MLISKYKHCLIIVLIVGLVSCGKQAEQSQPEAATQLTEPQVTEPKAKGPAHVEIRSVDGRYKMFVNGEPFVIKGVGFDYDDGRNFAGLKAAGGNTFRTWRVKDADAELVEAEKYGLMVAMGLDIGKELYGFDYNDEAAVAEQFEVMKKRINKYKDHPNVLCWIAGNELNLLFNEDGSLKPVNPKVYDALSDIIDYIHEVDPHHPVSYSFAGFSKEHIEVALARTPQVDFVSVQMYAALLGLPDRIKEIGIKRPIMVTEFGPTGHWEMPHTEWGREIEEPSGVKALRIQERIQKGIVEDTTGLVLGGYAFLWGYKRERTPTWFGMFNKSGEATATVDVLTHHWTGSYPENRAPLVHDIKLNGKSATDSVYLQPKSKNSLKVALEEPDGDELTYRWEILREVAERKEGGAREKFSDLVPFEILSEGNGELEFVAPDATGEFRIFAYASDGKGKVGNANFPFYLRN